MLKIVSDESIIFAREAFSSLGEVVLLPGREINNRQLADADILLVRSVTNVNRDLLDNTQVKFVGTATIGRDHIDQEYLKSKDIYFTDAAGCNADAVAEYVFTALFQIASEKQFNLDEKSIGIIGAGNIGSRVSKLASAAGMTVLKNDPPLKRLTHRYDYLELDELMNCDIITLHVPLNMDGVDKTFHFFDYKRLEKLKNGVILINASRGQVIDSSALLSLVDKKNITAVLDVWENEPNIDNELLKKTIIATPHIAGYSYEGKVNGTMMIYNSLCNYLNKAAVWRPVLPELNGNEIQIDNADKTSILQKLIPNIYKIKKDDEQLRGILELDRNEKRKFFDELRKNYPLRREFSNYSVKVKNSSEDIDRLLTDFRFSLID